MTMTMPFGKHRGESVMDVPTSYIVWALENDVIRSPRLREELEDQLRLREGEGVEKR